MTRNFAAALLLALIATAPARAQVIIDVGRDNKGSETLPVTTAPSVGNGIADGIVKGAGAPSVGNGVANGVVKTPGSPSVGNGIANGVVKQSTVNQ